MDGVNTTPRAGGAPENTKLETSGDVTARPKSDAPDAPDGAAPDRVIIGLVACPFCGYWRPSVMENPACKTLRWFVGCTHCLARGPAHQNIPMAISAWEICNARQAFSINPPA